MLPQLEFSAGLTATCCSTLQYLEGAAYIAIVLAVLGVPQLLTYYLDQRNQRRERSEDRAEAEQLRLAERTEAERVRQEAWAEAERIRQEDRAEAERRHHEMMTALTGTITALTALIERNGNGSSEQSGVIRQLQRRIDELESENDRLRNGNGNGPTHDPASE